MKSLSLLAFLVLAATAAFAEPPPADAWNITGTWDCVESAWTGTVTLNADKTFVKNGTADSGTWELSTQDGRVVLTLKWTDWPPEAVTMLSSDEFYGKSEQSFLRMRRQGTGPSANPALPPAAKPTTGGATETHAWHQGEPPVRLIRREEGFCALTMVTGNFQGDGEMVKVYVAEDGYWYLGGQSQQEHVAAECIVVRWPAR